MSRNNTITENRIREGIARCYEIIGDDTQLSRLKCSLDETVKRMDTPMQLAIIGRISSSKSTLVNAILGTPEVVSTGHEAETFNVSWLKYGSNDSPIKVHFKNGTCIEIPRSDWKNWSSHNGQESLKNTVQYLEIFREEEVLKDINIIDTPGLDAASKIDSENTKAFLKKVNPDAVVMVFTKSLSEDSLRLIDDFQQSEGTFSYRINPMNALGILSKVDLNWSVLNNKDILESSTSAIKRTLSNRTDVSKALFQIIPVSALLGLASNNISDKEFSAFSEFSKLEHTLMLRQMINTNSFVNGKEPSSVDVQMRNHLFSKFGLYGIHLCVETIIAAQGCSKGDLKKVLKEKSGFSSFVYLLYSHFGMRASLIKAQKALVSLLNTCEKESMENVALDEKIKQIRSEISKMEDELHELKEWKLMLDIYESRINMDSTFVDEFKRICGEHGYSALAKLDCLIGENVDEAIAKAKERASHWIAIYNIKRKYTISGAEPYRILSKSYRLLAENLQEQQKKYNEALRTIEISKYYIYGR